MKSFVIERDHEEKECFGIAHLCDTLKEQFGVDDDEAEQVAEWVMDGAHGVFKGCDFMVRSIE